jgi:tRNA pseudouridine55 synthase
MNVIINLDKPKGLTSQQAVTRVKKLLGAKKAGHAGTLDPLATGVLLICLDEATKISRFLMDKDKEYRAKIKLGERTDTLDAEGTVTETRPVPDLSEHDVAEAVREFIGRIMQRPPMYSAIKREGQPLYALARKGLIVDRPERPVEIHDIRVTGLDLPYIDLTVSCSKGTYIRSLCDDLGLKLGTVAHLISLERTRTGMFTVEKAAQLDHLSSDPGNAPVHSCSYSIDEALSEFPEIHLSEEEFRKAKNGVQLSRENHPEIPVCTFVRLKSPENELFGIGRVENEKISIERIMNV